MNRPERLIPDGAVKICGNRDPALCRLAVESGADMLGFIFVPGVRRLVSEDLAAECIAEAKRLGTKVPLIVGVFVNEDPPVINRIARQLELDVVQLHGDESPADLGKIDLAVLKALRPKNTDTSEDIGRRIEAFATASNAPIAYLIDGYDPYHHGGAGIRADWSLAAELAADFPVMVAGGLTPSNVGVAIETVSPIGVDVSSGVETDGARDPEKIQAFIIAAKQQFERIKHLEKDITLPIH